MEKEKRNRQPAIPENIESYLNEDQLQSLEKIENYGCVLKFVRRPAFQKATPVIIGPDGKKMGVLEENGNLCWEHGIVFRD